MFRISHSPATLLSPNTDFYGAGLDQPNFCLESVAPTAELPAFCP